MSRQSYGSRSPKGPSYTWDRSNDGKIDASDLLMSFDTTGDGGLDATELQRVAEQLSAQLEYNNSLLQQIQELEVSQLNYQRQVAALQESEKKYATAAEESRTELGDCKRKLKIAQEIADTVSKQLKDTKMENAALRSEAESATKSASEAKGLLKEVMEERTKLQKSLNNSQGTLSQVRSDAEQVIKQLKEQNDHLKETTDALHAEINGLRTRMVPLEAERDTLKGRIAELIKSLDESMRRCEAEVQQRMTTEKQVREMAHTIDTLCAKQNEVQGHYNEAKTIIEALKARLDAAEKQYSELEAQAQLLQSQNSQLQDAIHQATELNMSLQHDFNFLKQELATVNKNRMLDQQNWIEKMNALQKETQVTIQQTKEHAEEYAMEAQKHANDAIMDRKRTEEKCAVLQKECNELHGFIQELHKEQQAQLKRWEQTRAELESTMSQLQQKCLEQENEVSKIQQLHDIEKSDLHSVIKALKAESLQRMEDFVSSLSEMQNGIRKYRDESLSSREKIRDLSYQVSQLQKVCSGLKEKLQTPWNNYHPEVENVLTFLHGKWNEFKKQLDDHKDQLKQTQITREEERSKNLQLEEIISRMELDKHSMATRTAELQQQLEQRNNQHKIRMEQLMQEKSELESRLKRQQTALESALAQSRSVQVANQNMQHALNTSSTKFSAVKQEYESRLNALQMELRRLQEEKELQNTSMSEAKGQTKRLMEEIEQWRGQVEGLRAEKAKMEKENEAQLAKRAQAAAAAAETMQQHQLQLKQTQDILKVIQAQRAELQQQNQALRAELEKRSTTAPAR